LRLERLREFEEEAVKLANKFNRKGGDKEQLKNHLKLDLDLFDNSFIRYKREKVKIIYLLYVLKKKFEINVLQLLSKPSMENVDNSFLGWETSYGRIIKEIKNSLEKELSLLVQKKKSGMKQDTVPIREFNDISEAIMSIEEIQAAKQDIVVSAEEIKNALYEITSAWDRLLNNTCLKMTFMAEEEYNFEKIVGLCLLQPVPNNLLIRKKGYRHSPLETMYLKVLQHEYLGNIKDMLMINGIQSESNYNVPPDVVEEMKQFFKKHIAINDVGEYINDNALKIAKYVFKKSTTDKEDHRRIRKCTDKVLIILDFFERARPLGNIKGVTTELLVISCLQAIILDSKKEIFDYGFHAYQKQSTRKPHVQGALKNDNRTYDALQIYWYRKVMDHLFANIGRYDVREKLRDFESLCGSILIKILLRPNIDEMIDLHHFYIRSFMMFLQKNNGTEIKVSVQPLLE
jgi:hypothetical protein